MDPRHDPPDPAHASPPDHRITETLPRTWTLVLRGPKSRPWGFYLPTGYVVQTAYDYRARRPLAETRGRHDPDPERTVFLDGLGNTIGEAGS